LNKTNYYLSTGLVSVIIIINLSQINNNLESEVIKKDFELQEINEFENYNKKRRMKSEEQIFSYINKSEFNNTEIFFVKIFKYDYIL
jgi:hypothetical protein